MGRPPFQEVQRFRLFRLGFLDFDKWILLVLVSSSRSTVNVWRRIFCFTATVTPFRVSASNASVVVGVTFFLARAYGMPFLVVPNSVGTPIIRLRIRMPLISLGTSLYMFLGSILGSTTRCGIPLIFLRYRFLFNEPLLNVCNQE